MLSPPQFQHSKKSGTWYFCVHHETTGSPHTTHSVPHQPHTKTNSTSALPLISPLTASMPGKPRQRSADSGAPQH